MVEERSPEDDQQDELHPFDADPEKLAPRKPVYEQPLDGDVQHKNAVDNQTREDPVEEDIRQPTQEVPVFHSPYFPRGIFEDAQSVEGYYGRSEAAPDDERSMAEPEKERKTPSFRLGRLVLIVIALLMIVILVLSAALGGYTLPII